MAKIERVSVAVTAYAVGEKPIAFFLVGYSLLILVATLEANCFFVQRKKGAIPGRWLLSTQSSCVSATGILCDWGELFLMELVA